ncbi:MAG: class II aldolase/adducin family protein [Nitrospira sp.]
MNVPQRSLHSRSLQDAVSAAEWQTRVELAACYRLIAHYGMTDQIFIHITARVPGGDHYFLINPYGMLYEEVTASSLYKIDLDGNIILKPDTPYGINYAGFVIHSAVHAAREDAQCVIHTHTRAGTAVSAMKCGLLPISQHSLRFFERVSYHDYEGPALNLDERKRLIDDLGYNDVMILRNHGTLNIGRDIPEAFCMAICLEWACRIQVDALAGGGELTIPSRAASEARAALRSRPVDAENARSGSLEWSAMLRILEKNDPSYAT